MTFTVYGKDRCVQCDRTTKTLEKEEVDYKYIDVTSDPEHMNYIKGLGYLQVPVVITPRGEHWSGFRPDLIKQHV